MCFGWTIITCGADVEGGKCGMTFGVPDSYYRALQVNAGGQRGPLFSCPQGHRVSFVLSPDPRDQRIKTLEQESATARREAACIQEQATKEIQQAKRDAAKAEEATKRRMGVVVEADGKWCGYCPTCSAKQPLGSKNRHGAQAWRRRHIQSNHEVQT